jgi:DNA gyrase subunit A
VTFTRHGVVKRTPLDNYSNVRSTGIIALRLEDGDRLIGVQLVEPEQSLFMATSKGKSIRFTVEDVRAMGRAARGVTGIKLRTGDFVVGASSVAEDDEILSVTARGYGKRTSVAEYRAQGRAGFGLKNVNVTERTGPVVAALRVEPDAEIAVATKKGKVIRTGVSAISKLGRGTQGVRVIRLDDDDEVVSVANAGPTSPEEEGVDENIDREES